MAAKNTRPRGAAKVAKVAKVAAKTPRKQVARKRRAKEAP